MKVKVMKLFILLFIAIFILSTVNMVNALGVTATIPVGRAPMGVAYDSAKGEIFVTNGQDNTTSVISDSTNTVVATIPVGAYPYGVAYDSAKGEIYIVNLHSNSVSVISDSTNTVVATIPVGKSPYNIAYDSAKGELFVTNSYDSTVSVISDSTNKVVETITVSHSPWTITYDSGNGAIYVNCGAESGDNIVSVISGASTTSATPNTNPSAFDFGSIIWIIIIIIIIILLIIIILIWLSRQRKFTVTVQNSQTQSPISGATVLASGQQDLSGTTNNKGQTVFDDFKDGDYSIKANATGYIASMPISASVKNKTEVVIKLNPAPSGGPKEDSGRNGPDYEGKATMVVANEIPQTQTPAQSAPIIAPTLPPPPTQQETAEPQGWRDEKIQQIIQKFQEKGATSPQTALTAKELGLSRIFVRIMERRKEQTKIFVEVNGKYYLNQKAFEEKKQ